MSKSIDPRLDPMEGARQIIDADPQVFGTEAAYTISLTVARALLARDEPVEMEAEINQLCPCSEYVFTNWRYCPGCGRPLVWK